jgi:hypothetical protein
MDLTINDLYWMNSSALFPTEFSQDLVTNVSSMTVNNPLQTEVPFLAIPRTMHRSETKRSYTAIRWGIGAFFEMGRLDTAEGQFDFRVGMVQMANSMRRQAAWIAQAALLKPDSEEKAWQAMFGVRNYTSFLAAIQREVDDWAIVNRDQLGMLKVMNKYSKHIETNANISPNGLMVDQEVMTYLRFEPPRTTVYELGGPQAIANVNTDESRGYFNGVRVYAPLIYKPERDQPGSAPLTQSLRRIGSHYVLDPAPYFGIIKEYKSEHRTIIMYDEDRDSWARISLLGMLSPGVRLTSGRHAAPLGPLEQVWHAPRRAPRHGRAGHGRRPVPL